MGIGTQDLVKMQNKANTTCNQALVIRKGSADNLKDAFLVQSRVFAVRCSAAASVSEMVEGLDREPGPRCGPALRNRRGTVQRGWRWGPWLACDATKWWTETCHWQSGRRGCWPSAPRRNSKRETPAPNRVPIPLCSRFSYPGSYSR